MRCNEPKDQIYKSTTQNKLQLSKWLESSCNLTLVTIVIVNLSRSDISIDDL